MNNTSVAGVRVPDSKLAQAATELVRDTESDLLFHHSSRVYYFGALAGLRQKLKFDSELLYIGAMFHDMGLTENTVAPPSVSKLTVQMPRATSCGSIASTRQASTWSGMPSRCTRRRAFLGTRSRKWRSSQPASIWTCSDLVTLTYPTLSGRR